MKVFAVDPGPHTGCAVWEAQPGEDPPEYFAAWETTPHDYQGFEGWIAWADVVVVEDFVIRGSRAAPSNVTIELIGVLRYLARDKTFVTQPPGAYRFAGPDKLKLLGWYSKSDHSRSATGHLVVYLVENNLIDRRRLLAISSEGV